ncbi:serine protease Do [Enterococcus sp. PF1-24]|uniref:S1C family serine protease n=1 Tax=unclassified Enterococcus TaxID=2608891 RepID=UPI002474D6DE|nr:MULTISPECIES: trypsin-like peptidase domain-containing protein [unclassified Enterococcus]MDH6364234.1 serine protease Do [Enterococcus sp. PFB1-1]MDH6401407.1 serine protease Do [Enterococcus sp. PF1-24]
MKEVNNNQKKSGSLLSRFGVGLAGGILGGLLVFGGSTLINNNNDTVTPATNNNAPTTEGTTQVSNVKVNTQSDITEAVNKVQDAVVSIINYQSNSSSDTYSEIFGGDLFGEEEETDDDTLVEAGEGSGVIYAIEGDKAYIVTNNHVIADHKELKVLLKDGTSVPATLVGTDEYTDLAVVEISSEGISTHAEFGDSDALTVGEPAIAIGSPLGTAYANSVTSGIISSLNREVTLQLEDNSTATSYAIQTDAAINPGNSGGPLININGQIIGINSSKIISTYTGTGTASVEGMGFAIPSNQVISIINQLVEKGEVVRPALGVTMVDLANLSTQQLERYFDTLPEEVTAGVALNSVSKGTPADEAGLQKFDVITEVDGKEVATSSEVKSALYEKQVGDKLEITYYRDGKKESTTVNLTMEASALSQIQETEQEQAQEEESSNSRRSRNNE